MAARASDLNGLLGRLTTWTAVVLVVAVAITMGVVLYPSLVGAAATSTTPPPPPAYGVGSRIDTPADWHAGSPYTLVLFAQASCGACQRAQPFLKQVADEFADLAPVVLVSPNQFPAADASFAESLGLDPAALRPLPGRVRARVTPTLVLVDQTGTVLQSWEGVPPDDQADIRDTIARATRAGRTASAP
ncbi:MAG TPA: hypothetical protein VMM93_10925 [Vicinamibacterales bacterium]|nr:hypothetical protein [Vicinamibacterales bacterium]